MDQDRPELVAKMLRVRRDRSRLLPRTGSGLEEMVGRGKKSKDIFPLLFWYTTRQEEFNLLARQGMCACDVLARKKDSPVQLESFGCYRRESGQRNPKFRSVVGVGFGVCMYRGGLVSCPSGHALCWLDPCLVWQPVAQSYVDGSLGFGGDVSKDWCGRE